MAELFGLFIVVVVLVSLFLIFIHLPAKFIVAPILIRQRIRNDDRRADAAIAQGEYEADIVRRAYERRQRR
ncbi:hypothetical protein CH278_02645 [Rhodococcus sp. 05-2254-5]|uniref:hypothetical protein n=1 Tax=unclassified Rhodococcus (in: high G+C Gram-positive bacteria) TaxID=192944 RepID=UPI000B9B4E4F|nr:MULTISPECIES: hypothetical protein [unclassified Rhodococcus (in: high G+C Gram-positive bacteria)]OZE39184.1 hypothetical protein CH278_02645 [Rhodococcus sp. 05-2254-5]OZE59125.1 hypothetical protein CH269_09140 [Rhodococcus sp. 05-2254-1]